MRVNRTDAPRRDAEAPYTLLMRKRHLLLEFAPTVALTLIGSSNACNLTDGMDGLAISCTLVVALVLYVLVTRTRAGMLVRAGASNREMATAMGVNIKLLFTVVFAFGAGQGLSEHTAPYNATIQIIDGENLVSGCMLLLPVYGPSAPAATQSTICRACQ